MDSLTDLSTIRSLMAEYGFSFSKKLGQNFLINPSVCPRMAELGGADAGVGVLEIGPGFGVLTAALAARAQKVAAVELDRRLLPVLAKTLAAYRNVEIVEGDALRLDLRALLAREFPGMEVVVCANLPYYITSPVIMHLLESRLPVRSMTFMVQKEAGRRLCAEPGSREAGAVSYAVHYYARPEILFDVSAGSFMPRPKVDSCVIRLCVREEPAVRAADEALLFRVIRASFSQRRKTLRNALAGPLGLGREKADAALARAGIPPAERGERLTLEEFAALADAVRETAGAGGAGK